MDRKKPPTAAEIEKQTRAQIASPASNEELRSRLEEMAGDHSFLGFTWLWGPALCERNRVLFRPFILSHFSTFLIKEMFRWEWIEWKGEKAAALEKWLGEADRSDDVELFRRLYAWKMMKGPFHRPDDAEIRRNLCSRFEEAGSPARRATALDKFKLWFTLDEITAQKLNSIDNRAAKPFIIRHLPVAWWDQSKRALWKKLYESAKEKGDEEMAFTLYRKQIPIQTWRSDIMQICDSLTDIDMLNEELEKRHHDGYGVDLEDVFHQLVLKRGRDVFPYVTRNLRSAWLRRLLLKSRFDKLAELSYQKGWLDLWSALMRIVMPQKDYNSAVSKLLDDSGLSTEDRMHRLLLLCGTSMEWNFHAFGFMQVRQLDDEMAVKLYEKYPHLLRGPFQANISLTWGRPYRKLPDKLKKLITLASRIVREEGFTINRGKTRVMRGGRRQSVAGVMVNVMTGLSRKELRKFRTEIHRLKREKEEGRASPAEVAFSKGKLSYLAMLNKEQAEKLKSMLGPL